MTCTWVTAGCEYHEPRYFMLIKLPEMQVTPNILFWNWMSKIAYWRLGLPNHHTWLLYTSMEINSSKTLDKMNPPDILFIQRGIFMIRPEINKLVPTTKCQHKILNDKLTTRVICCCHTISQKSAQVLGRGPWAAIYLLTIPLPGISMLM